MNPLITITGRDIIGWDDQDHTGALKELGVEFRPLKHGIDPLIADMTFQVPLDFVLRHGHLMNDEIYDSHYRGSTEYLRYYNEGRDAYLAGKEEEPPYDTGTTDDPDYWTTSIYHKRYPWYDGYREARDNALEKRHAIRAMQAEIREVVERHGLTVEDCDEYPASYSYAKTPEGYPIKLT